MKEVREIKKIQTRLRKLEGEISDICRFVVEYQQVYENKRQEKEMLIEKIKEMQKGDLKVSEHAMLRYIERVMGIDLVEVETNLMQCMSDDQKKLGNGVYPCVGFKAVVKENTIITITV